MKFRTRLSKIRYGCLKQSVLMATHHIVHSYKVETLDIKLSNKPIPGGVVFVKNKAYMVSHFGGGRERRATDTTWHNTLDLIEINKTSIPKFAGHGIVYACDVDAYHKQCGWCPCELREAIV